MNDQTDAELYRELVNSDTLPKDATAIVDAGFLPIRVWIKVHCQERIKDAKHFSDHERHY